jgi:ribonuclease HII
MAENFLRSTKCEGPSSVLSRLLAFDEEAAHGIGGCIAGMDEAGRGPLAGPVVAAAVIFVRNPQRLTGLNDSKKVAPKRREILFREISRLSLVGIGVVDEAQIDEINIYQATRLAMKRALLSLSLTPQLVLIDGNLQVDVPISQRAVIGGDQKSAAIAAASIVAKVHRDAWMVYLDRLYPDYCFRDHKGYATPTHLRCLHERGPSPVHRRSFAPVRNLSRQNGS